MGRFVSLIAENEQVALLFERIQKGSALPKKLLHCPFERTGKLFCREFPVRRNLIVDLCNRRTRLHPVQCRKQHYPLPSLRLDYLASVCKPLTLAYTCKPTNTPPMFTPLLGVFILRENLIFPGVFQGVIISVAYYHTPKKAPRIPWSAVWNRTIRQASFDFARAQRHSRSGNCDRHPLVTWVSHPHSGFQRGLLSYLTPRPGDLVCKLAARLPLSWTLLRAIACTTGLMVYV